MKKIIAVILCILVIALPSGCSQNAVKKYNDSAVTYQSSKSASDLFCSQFTLKGEDEFVLTYSPMSSFLCTGTYTLEDGILTLNDRSGLAFVFKADKERYIFDASSSSVVPDVASEYLYDGASFNPLPYVIN